MQLMRILRSRLLAHVAYLAYRTAIKLCDISALLRNFGDRAYRASTADYAPRPRPLFDPPRKKNADPDHPVEAR